MARTYDFSKVKLVGIDGKSDEVDNPIHKTIGNIIFNMAKTLDLVEVAREIWAGKAVSLKSNEAKEIKNLVAGEQSGIFSFARKAISEYMDEVEKQPEKKNGK